MPLVPDSAVVFYEQTDPSCMAGPCQDLQLVSVPCFPLDIAIFPLVVQSGVKLWDLWKQFSLFRCLQDRSEQYQQSEAHSNKLFMKDSLPCLHKHSAKLCFSTDHRDVKDTRGRQTIKRHVFYSMSLK